jgi:hypothetical protein
MPRSSQWSLTFGFPNQNPVNTSPLPHTCHMSSPPQPPWFNHPNKYSVKSTGYEVGLVPCHHTTARPQVADGENPPVTEGSCEHTE